MAMVDISHAFIAVEWAQSNEPLSYVCYCVCDIIADIVY